MHIIYYYYNIITTVAPIVMIIMITKIITLGGIDLNAMHAAVSACEMYVRINMMIVIIII